jgi:chitinase
MFGVKMIAVTAVWMSSSLAEASLLPAGSVASAYSNNLKYYFPRQTAPQYYPSTFDATGNTALAVYYGKAQYNSAPSLWDLCSVDDIDMIVMGFIRNFNGFNKQPTFDVGACKTPYQPAANYTGVLCPTLAANITRCQMLGKKVMISLGGSSANLDLASETDAQQAAITLWNVFGAGTDTPTARPFGNVTLDGFDFGSPLVLDLRYDS